MTRDEIDHVLKRIGTSKDGAVLIEVLLAEQMATSGPGVDDGALRHREGRRTFAAELIGRLSPDAGATSGRANGQRSDDADDGRSGRRGGGRRVPNVDPKRYPKR